MCTYCKEDVVEFSDWFSVDCERKRGRVSSLCLGDLSCLNRAGKGSKKMPRGKYGSQLGTPEISPGEVGIPGRGAGPRHMWKVAGTWMVFRVTRWAGIPQVVG